MKRNQLDDTIINDSRVFIENGEVKTELSEDIQRTGYINLNDSKRIVIDMVKKIYAMNALTEINNKRDEEY